MGTKTWIPLGALCAAAVVAMLWQRQDESAPSGPGVPSAPTGSPSEPATGAVITPAGGVVPGGGAVPGGNPTAGPTAGPEPLPAPVLRTPEQAGIPREDCIVYPDGTRFPPLNGVKKAPQLAFHRETPFSKVVGMVRDSRGVEWYVHENGVRSTTYLDGRGVPLGEVAKDAPVMPIDPGTGR